MSWMARPCAFERGYSTVVSQTSGYSSSLTLKPGGSAAVTSWKFSDFSPLFYPMQKVIQPATPITSNPVEKWELDATLKDTLLLRCVWRAV